MTKILRRRCTKTSALKSISLKAFTCGLIAAATMMATPATAHNNWYVGAGSGSLKGTASTAVGTTNRGAGAPIPSQHIRSQFSDTAPAGAIFMGHTSHATNYSWFVQGRGFWDNSTLQKTVQFTPGVVLVGPATAKISRLGTLAFDGGISKSYKGFDFSLQLGILLSKFEIKFDDTRNRFSKTGTQYSWGVAPGIKVERDLGAAIVGIGYEYQIYAPIKYSCTYTNLDLDNAVRSTPRYHSVMATIRKTF